MNPDDPLLKILACPLDKGPLHLLGSRTGGEPAGEALEGTEAALYNPRLRRRYPIVDGIPQLLPSSGEQVTDDEHEDLLLRISGGGDPGGFGGSRDGTRKPGSMTP
ncbi:Trm112 family protein [Streptomyces sp. NPDC060205]|uniref:Trm112 family protein n=1 Tax=Streptomyces sp. NPDC060205 TaxID=3347072 RepID=UPI0036607679